MATDTCQYTFIETSEPCPYPPIAGAPYNYCIFHSQNDEKDKKAFWEGIKDKLKKEDFDFESYYFPYGLEANFTGQKFKDANFLKAIFKGDVYFSGALFEGENTNFESAEFSGTGKGTDFNGVEFKGENTSFRFAKFSGKQTDFANAKFLRKNISFESAKFSGEGTYFLNAILFGKSNFIGAGFSAKRTYFSGARFTGETHFEVTSFSGESTDFSWAEFSGDTDFSWADFYECGTISFINTVFGGECMFLGVKFPWKSDQFVIYRGTKYPIDLSKTVFLYCNNYDRILFRNCRFSEGQDEVFGRKFPFWKRRVILNDELFVGKKLELRIQGQGQGGKETNRKGIFWEVEKKAILEEVRVEYSHVESLYRQFKKNLEAEKDWETAGEFHYGEMECKRKGITSKWSKLVWIRQNFGLLAWYKYFSGYGERPFRAFCWIAFLLLFFTGVYCLLDAPPRQSLWYYFWEISVKAAFLQRIGETGHEPIRPLGKLIYLFQSALCPTLIALFILALRRRVRR